MTAVSGNSKSKAVKSGTRNKKKGLKNKARCHAK